jgi:hypothetical protein
LCGDLDLNLDLIRQALGCGDGVLHIGRIVPRPPPAPFSGYWVLLSHPDLLHLAGSQRRKYEIVRCTSVAVIR